MKKKPPVRKLDPTLRSDEVRELEQTLHNKIVGQEEAVQALVDAYEVFKAGLNPPDHPVASLMFLGPTGCGKTLSAETMAEELFGTKQALRKVDCEEFQHSHEISRLLGSPAGYIGHRETQPFLTQETLEEFCTPALKMSLVLFDEVEKASDSLWNLLLGILDKAMLTLGDGKKTNFSHAIIIMTGNIGSREIQHLAEGGLGFSGSAPEKASDNLDKTMDKTVVTAAQKRFSPEFMNRIDRLVVFHSLRTEHLRRVVELELQQVQNRVFRMSGQKEFVLSYTDKVRDLLLEKGTDLKNGARPLKRVIESLLVKRLASLISTSQIRYGDFVQVDEEGGALTFTRMEEGVLPKAKEAAAEQ